MPRTSDVFEAIKTRDINRLRDLIAAEPELAAARDQHGVSAVLVAQYHRQSIIAELLEKSGIELDVYEAAALGRVGRLESLLVEDAARAFAFASDGFTPLHLAAFFAQPEAVRLLLARGAPVEVVAQNPMKVTPLHSAAAGRSAEIVRLLLEAGADPNAKQQEGFTALHAAAMHDDVEMARALIEHGADPDARTDDGKTPRAMASGKQVAALMN